MPVSFVAGVAHNETNPATGFTFTIPTTVLPGDYLQALWTSRNHTSVDPASTISDTSALTWTRLVTEATQKSNAFFARAGAGSPGATITVAGCIGPAAGILVIYRGAFPTDPAHSNNNTEANALADETQAGFTPALNDSMICLTVFNHTANNAVTSPACTTPGALTPRIEALSAAGSTCGVFHASALQIGGPTATGTFSWAQTDAATKSQVMALKSATVNAGMDEVLVRAGGPVIALTLTGGDIWIPA